MAGLWFTASTSFANPAVTIARMLTDTFSGITPAHAPAFIAAQFVGAALAVPTVRFLGRARLSRALATGFAPAAPDLHFRP